MLPCANAESVLQQANDLDSRQGSQPANRLSVANNVQRSFPGMNWIKGLRCLGTLAT